MGRRMTLEEIREIKQLQDQGKTTAEIMKITGRSNSTVLFWKKNEPRIKELSDSSLLRESWKAHCDTCIYAFRKPIESDSLYSSAACELEVEDKKSCRKWMDTKITVPIPEWITIEEDLPQVLKNHKSITVYMRLRNGEKVEGFYNDNTHRWYYKSGKRIPDEDPVIKWRSKDE